MSPTHYDTLNLTPQATADEIKQAYRRLAKAHHPDLFPRGDHRDSPHTNHDRIAAINVAYEVLGDRHRRQDYDRQLCLANPLTATPSTSRQARTAAAAARHRTRPAANPQADEAEQWLRQVYSPIERSARELLKSLKPALSALAADPFDDDLMGEFETYLERSRSQLDKARAALRSQPNPAVAAGVAAHLYYCLDRLTDGLGELSYYPLSYDDSRLHDGREMFRIAEGLRKDALAAVRHLKA